MKPRPYLHAQALPTVALFVRGQPVFRFEGAMTEAQLIERLNYYLSSAASSGKQ